MLSFGYNEISEQISEKYKCNLYYAPSNKLDYNFLNKIKDSKLLITIEDGIINGGAGEKISNYLSLNDIKVLNVGLKQYDYFNNPNNKTLGNIYKQNNMDIDSISKIIDGVLK